MLRPTPFGQSSSATGTGEFKPARDEIAVFPHFEVSR